MKTYMLLSACLLLLGSCQKKTENADTVVSDTTSTTTATPEETAGDDGEFCYLKVISKDSISPNFTDAWLSSRVNINSSLKCEPSAS